MGVDTATKLIVVGGVMLLASWCLLLFIVFGRVASNFVLNFSAYAMSVVGLVMGLFGVAQHTRRARR